MDKFLRLVALCKCEVNLSVNPHRSYYETVERFLDDLENEPNIPADILQRMVETDTVVDLQFYPNTPIGFHRIFHYDVDAALTMALDCMEGGACSCSM